MQIRDSTFLISGGSGGLGAACAREFVSAGGRVVIADLNAAAGEQLASELGESAHFVSTDVTDGQSVANAVSFAVTNFGGLHGAISCAGILDAGRVVGRDGPHDLEKFARVVNVNLIGTFNVIRLAAAAMIDNEPNAEGERGVLINTASVAAYEGQIGQAAYSASKGGIVGMTLPVARELARHGIRVVSIAPGVFETPMMADVTPEVRQSLTDQIPFPPRLGRADEYAALARHVVENAMINGTTIRLDGALRMQGK